MRWQRGDVVVGAGHGGIVGVTCNCRSNTRHHPQDVHLTNGRSQGAERLVVYTRYRPAQKANPNGNAVSGNLANGLLCGVFHIGLPHGINLYSCIYN